MRHVVLCGNQNRAWQYRRAKWSWLLGKPIETSNVAKYNFYASIKGMTQLLEGCGYTIETVVADGDPIVVGSKLIPGAHTV